ncbi:MAG: HlyD family efflux transporter periplasmic adaptor subunit, partial [Deltaproteobacteria bacterium]|nr:HlyD family efflux transporter periplasmic adaptor subunit [Deltaproteobacteria bacterium]
MNPDAHDPQGERELERSRASSRESNGGEGDGEGDGGDNGGGGGDAHRAPRRAPWALGDPGALSRAVELAVSTLPEVSLKALTPPHELSALSDVVAWLSRTVNISARHVQMSAADLAEAARGGATLVAPAALGWLSVSEGEVTLITAHGERRLSLSSRGLRRALGARVASVILLEPHLNLEPLTRAAIGRGGPVSPWGRLWALMGLERQLIGALLTYAVALGALSLAAPIAVQVLVNTIAFGTLTQPLVMLAVLLFGVLVLSGGIKIVEFYAVELLQRRLFVRVAEDLSRRLSLATEEGRAKVEAYGLANRFFEVVTLQKAAGKLIVDGGSLALQTVVGMLLLGFYHPALLAFDIALVVCFVVVLVLGRGAVPTAVEESEAKYAMAAWVEGVALEPERFCSADGARRSAVSADSLVRAYLAARKRHFRVLLRQAVGGVSAQIVSTVTLLGLGGWLVMRGELTLGQLVAAELVVGSLGANLSKLGKLLESAYDLLAGVDKLGKVVDLPHAPRPPESVLPSTALHAAGSTEALSRLSRTLVALCLLGAVALLWSPWQQSVRGEGRVVAYAPLERQQVVEAPIEGRVLRWFVQEGSRVEEGAPIVELSDNDPEIMARLERERAAAAAQVEAASLSISLTEDRVRSEVAARESSIDTARMRVKMAFERREAAQQAMDGAEATLKTATLNLRRVRVLQSKGISSRRELEVAELEERKGATELDRARATLAAAVAEVRALEADQSKVGLSARAGIESTRASLEKLRSERAKAEAELAKVEVRLARQSQMRVLAPRAGTILRFLAKQGAEMVKAGEPLVALVPDSSARAVELFVDGNDAPLVEAGREVRLQFEGWPAVQFVGWPSVAVGTFPGRVDFVDSHGDGQGHFRVVVTPVEGQEWPEGRYLRQGVRAHGWVLLNEVSLGFELWRQLNGFPPSALSFGEE